MEKLKIGIYETIYGNACEVEDWESDWAYDIDMGKSIPIEMVDVEKFIKDLS